MAEKKLVVVVEGTAALGPYWNTLYSDYLKKLIRAFVGDQEANPNVQLAIVQFHAHENSPCLVQRGGWVRDVDYYFDMLEAMSFNGGGFSDAAIAEGLAEVLMICQPPKEGQTDLQNGGLQMHSILVAASNPYPLPTPVYRPPDNSGTQPESCLSDAETLVKSFSQCLVSLSVICPRQLTKLKSIYNAAKRNPLAADHTINIAKNPHYIVLISNDLVAALADSNQSGITTLPSDNRGSNTEGASLSEAPDSPGWKSVPVKLFHRTPAKSSGQSTITSLVANDEIMPSVSAVQTLQSGYVKLWEGELSGRQKGESVVLTRLQSYRKWNTSAELSKHWPLKMQFNHLMSRDFLNKENYAGKPYDRLGFVALDHHPFFDKMQEKNFCAVIGLPSHTLVLLVSDIASTWVGFLYPKDTVPKLPIPPWEQPPSKPQSKAKKDG